ncbi:MAG: alanine racemase [Planctomycetes bacterium]|nr:alanine racemase [Planctomycetota bacterium]
MTELNATPSNMARVWARVNLDAVAHNVRAIKGLLKHGAGLMAVVKSNAYGHGAKQVAQAALASGAQSLGVVRVSEGIELRDAGIEAPVLLLGPCCPDEHLPGIEADLTFAVSSEDEIEQLAEKTRAAHQGHRRGNKTKVHLMVDTGMGRSGFAPDELWPAAERVKAERTLALEGVFTHFSSAEESDPAPTREQVALFRGLVRSLEEKGVRFRVRHAANSAATVFHPDAQLDLVRCGTLLHGLRAWPAGRDGLELRPSLSLHTRIVHLGKRPAGWTVGYNRTFKCARESVLATLPVGYSDGYRRAISGRGEVIVRGCRLPVVGTISMDYIVVDVTALAHTSAGLPDVGEEVTLIGAGPDGRERISVEDLAAASGTIPYVVTAQLNALNVERRYAGGPAVREADTVIMPRVVKAAKVPMELRKVEPPKAIPLVTVPVEEKALHRAAGA